MSVDAARCGCTKSAFEVCFMATMPFLNAVVSNLQPYNSKLLDRLALFCLANTDLYSSDRHPFSNFAKISMMDRVLAVMSAP